MLIGNIQGGDPDNAYAIVSASTKGIEFECDSTFVLTSHQAIQFAALIMQAVQARLDVAGEIRDPEALMALIPADPTSTRVIRRRRA